MRRSRNGPGSSNDLASATALVARLRRVPETVNELLLIGHNPGLEDLALLLIFFTAVQLLRMV